MDRREIEKRIEEMEAAECLDYALLCQWAEHLDALIREQVAAALVFGEGEPGREILLELAADSEELVRAEAYDTLSVYPDSQVAEMLKQAAVTEPDDLARYFALVSYADVMQELAPGDAEQKAFFWGRLQREQAAVCRLGCEYALYQLGEPEALERILGYLDDPDYLVRCRAVCTLEEIVDEENRGQILEAVRGRREKESAVPVRVRMDEGMLLIPALNTAPSLAELKKYQRMVKFVMGIAV